MLKRFFLLISFVSVFFNLHAQDDAAYLRAHAVRIDNPDKLHDSISVLLSPFQIIMMGEMHGTNEPAQFVTALANLFTNKNDSIQVGLEIPAGQMTQFFTWKTDSSIYSSDFFRKPVFESGRESFAWAGLISKLKDNQKIQIFFFDVNTDEGKPYERDSLMYAKIKKQFKIHPSWKMITLSGNFHNITSEGNTIASYLNRDKELNLSSKLCTLNLHYLEGKCLANFGKGLEEKQLGHPPSIYDTALTFDKYLVLVSEKSTYRYTGFYYTKYITPTKMVNSK